MVIVLVNKMLREFAYGGMERFLSNDQLQQRRLGDAQFLFLRQDTFLF